MNDWVWWMLRYWSNCSTITDIQNPNIIVNYKDHDGTWASLVVRLIRWWSCQLQEIFLSLPRSLPEGFRDIVREFRLKNYIVMQVIFQVFCTFAATMTIIDSKNLQFRPLLCRDLWCLLWRLNHVKDDWYSILVGLANDTDICIGCESFHSSEGLRTYLTRLEEW